MTLDYQLVQRTVKAQKIYLSDIYSIAQYYKKSSLQFYNVVHVLQQHFAV